MSEQFRSLNEIIEDLKELAGEDVEDNKVMSDRLAAAVRDLRLISEHCLGYKI